MDRAMYSYFNVKMNMRAVPVGRRSTSWADMAQLRVVLLVLDDSLSPEVCKFSIRSMVFSKP